MKRTVLAGVVCLALFVSLLAIASSSADTPAVKTPAAQAGEEWGKPVEGEVQPGLKWIDDESGEKLFDIDDIVRFDWDKQIFELTRPAAMDLLGKQRGLHRKFVLIDGEKIIYEGNLVSSSSSISYPGPAIVFENLDGIKPPLFKIDNGYPEQIAKSDPDLRFSERLKQALQQADMLGEIDINNSPTPITVISEWVVKKEDLRIQAKIFPETFRLGEKARIVICVAKDASFESNPDVIQIDVLLKANGGKFGCSSLHEVPLKQLLADGSWTIEHMPWGPIFGSIDSYAKVGPAEISIRVLTRKKVKKGPNTASYSKVVENFERSEPIKITILPKAQPAVQPPANTDEPRAHIWKKYPVLKQKQDKALAAMTVYLKSLEPEAFAAKHQEIVRLSTSKDPVDRDRALNAIAALRDLTALPILVEAVEDKGQASSCRAVMLLADWAYDAYHEVGKKVPKELAPLLPLFIKRLSEVAKDEQPNNRAYCFQAIGCLADSEWLPLVKDLSASRHPAVTHWAVWATEQLSKRDKPATQE